jgi:hypothetical protein
MVRWAQQLRRTVGAIAGDSSSSSSKKHPFIEAKSARAVWARVQIA